MMAMLASVVALLLTSLVFSNGFLLAPTKNRGRQDYTFRCSDYQRKTTLYASGTDESESQTWNDATVLSVKDACPSGKSLLWRVQVSPTLFDSYKKPGQFVQLRINDKDPLFLAMCSAPFIKEENVFEFLVKKTPNIPWLPTVQSGANVQLTNIMGHGFGLDTIMDTNPCDVIMCVAGSGIAPIKACIESGNIKSSNVQLYYGEWTANDLCFTAEYRKWGENVNVIPCLSRESNNEYRHGHVQDVLQQNDTTLFSSCTAILCGMPEMEESVRTILLQKGIPEQRILTNLT